MQVDRRRSARDAARTYEEALPASRRKALGQYFSGVKLGKLLAHLALSGETVRVIDPMAGSGDLLDAACEAARERKISVSAINGIEIDPGTAALCADRLAATCDERPQIIPGDAFDPATAREPGRTYDLVITNPPYVRYQSLGGEEGRGARTRDLLRQRAGELISGGERPVWETLVAGYSGLADLSVPAWLLSALLVRPGGKLALIVPATWRTRDYADVIRYLLLRCFVLEAVVEDTQPGWFSDALVRTHLIVARRREGSEIAKPLGAGVDLGQASWIQVAPEAAHEDSLVGAAFSGQAPERAFAAWIEKGAPGSKVGITVRHFDLAGEWRALRSRAAKRSWLRKLEPAPSALPLFAGGRPAAPALPEALSDCIPSSLCGQSLTSLDQISICAGQGLRTGCNRFFYVTLAADEGGSSVQVRTSSALGGQLLAVPRAVLRPVLHRQADIHLLQKEALPTTRVLDLNEWVLPEDLPAAKAAAPAYELAGLAPPREMPEALAAFVRKASATSFGEGSPAISELSAVRTNVRVARRNAPPRFWYMLPPFAPRHLPLAFTPRINHGPPRVEANPDRALLIDANFSTLWAEDESWSPNALAALLNSAWCRALMEAAGTPLGGGALKLEAAHLRMLPVPRVGLPERQRLEEAGRALRAGSAAARSEIDRIVMGAALPEGTAVAALDSAAAMLHGRAESMCRARQRIAS